MGNIPGCEPKPKINMPVAYSQSGQSIQVNGEENIFGARRLNMNMADVRRTINEARVRGFGVVNG